jgi:serine phosphatase RsbU (regulator of sigma subunit)
MPPVLLYRASEQTTHTILLKDRPLGAGPGFPYVKNKYELYEIDVLLFMSDGFMELLNPYKEMVGINRK